tara:strand:- start:65 stop:1510 length:1446 start_codon:yes stop_codon:yes gene_type:complete
MATSIIEQKPRHTTLPVEQDIIFTISNNAIVATELKVKFIAEVYISSELPTNITPTTVSVGTFKTTPNNAGVGMFDFRSIVESYVRADNMAANDSAYKETTTTDNTTHPLHLIDKYSSNTNSFRYLNIEFSVEYLGADATEPNLVSVAAGSEKLSTTYQLFNGYLKHSNILDLQGVNFGYNLRDFTLNSSTRSFLTNAPATQYANIEDYGTVGILMLNSVTNIEVVPLAPNDGFMMIRFDYYEEDGSLIDYETIRLDTSTTGGFPYANRDFAKNKLNFAGVYPANLRGWSTKFNSNIADIAYYTFVAQTGTISTATDISQNYRININCPTLKGFEPIRLTWLNQWGAWDYYTFNMKSIRKISTRGSTYNQLGGTWNESAYRINSFKGGKKSFRVNATENITVNTDFVSESEGEWFEELINSPEVYILQGFQTDITDSALNQYVTPVRLTTSSYTRKTVANDRLMQYTFEVEKSKTLRTQSV